MIKNIASSSMVYAGSALLFSIGRQIIFFPLLNKISPALFINISFLVVLIDFIFYSFGASIADYYVKNVTKDNKNLKLYKFLLYFGFLSLFSFFIFLFYNISLLLCLLLSVYILFYVLNTLQMKIYFNNLKFEKNYLYIFFRLTPYFLLLLYEQYIGINSMLCFVLALLLFEIISFIYLKKDLRAIYLEIKTIDFIWDKKVFVFILLYGFLAITLRLDMFIVEYFYQEKFSEYYQMISIYMIFINPIILLTSASLLSILTNIEFKYFLKNKVKIFAIIVGISVFAGLLFQLFGKHIVLFLYPNNDLIIQFDSLSFIVISTSISFQILKTFIIKYKSIQNIFLINILSITLPTLFIGNFVEYIVSFFTIRSIVYIYTYLRI